MAYDEGLDVVQISDQEVPVVKITDANKFLFSLKQKDRAQKKAQRQSSLKTKEVQLSLDIQDHDMNVKAKNANKFLAKGNSVKVILKLNGRAKNNTSMQELGLHKVQDFLFKVHDHEVLVEPYASETIICTIKPSS